MWKNPTKFSSPGTDIFLGFFLLLRSVNRSTSLFRIDRNRFLPIRLVIAGFRFRSFPLFISVIRLIRQNRINFFPIQIDVFLFKIIPRRLLLMVLRLPRENWKKMTLKRSRNLFCQSLVLRICHLASNMKVKNYRFGKGWKKRPPTGLGKGMVVLLGVIKLS